MSDLRPIIEGILFVSGDEESVYLNYRSFSN